MFDFFLCGMSEILMMAVMVDLAKNSKIPRIETIGSARTDGRNMKFLPPVVYQNLAACGVRFAAVTLVRIDVGVLVDADADHSFLATY